MPAGDIYTQTGGAPPVGWVDPATVIAANGRVLASVTSGGGKIPQWMDATDAQSGGNKVYTVFFDSALGGNRPAWLPLPTPIVPIYGLWFSNQSADTIEIQTDDMAFFLGVVTNANLSGATYPVIRRFGNYIWITNLPNNTIVILNLDGTGFGTILDVSGDLTGPVTFCEVSGKVWVFTSAASISVFAYDGTPDATPTLTPTGYAAPNAPSFAQHIGTNVWLTNAGTGVTILIADDGSAVVLTLSGIVGKGVAQVGSDEVWVGADSPGTIKRYHINGTAYGGTDVDVHDAGASLMDIVVTDTYIYVLDNSGNTIYQFDLTCTLTNTFTGLDFVPFSAAWVHA